MKRVIVTVTIALAVCAAFAPRVAQTKAKPAAGQPTIAHR
jgi:hypothetical protein